MRCAKLSLRGPPARDWGWRHCIAAAWSPPIGRSAARPIRCLSSPRSPPPVSPPPCQPLAFRRWSPGDPLSDGPLGLREPPPDAPALDPDLLFVPLAAFDRAGHRLGYGAGYYDATLAARAAKRPLAIGLAFSTQEVERVPAEPHDHPLAFVITERETIACGAQSDHASSVHR
jgi:5-formyltetrahydrofolate cyclo-ligase family